ncbi:hypothetical protein Scep_009132 [Stephania cephalantha]|uniref:Uncharacterized protein n=1 Tax=Stephania cephalantha TaxID=152367 RepID=A0AAP0PG04_9MAGN
MFDSLHSRSPILFFCSKIRAFLSLHTPHAIAKAPVLHSVFRLYPGQQTESLSKHSSIF